MGMPQYRFKGYGDEYRGMNEVPPSLDLADSKHEYKRKSIDQTNVYVLYYLVSQITVMFHEYLQPQYFGRALFSAGKTSYSLPASRTMWVAHIIL
jgi:hypothetical protein